MYRNNRGTGNRPSSGWSNGFQGTGRNGPVYKTIERPDFPVPTPHAGDPMPTVKQIKFMEDTSVTLSVAIPMQCKTSQAWVRAFLTFYKPKLDALIAAKRMLE